MANANTKTIVQIVVVLLLFGSAGALFLFDGSENTSNDFVQQRQAQVHPQAPSVPAPAPVTEKPNLIRMALDPKEIESIRNLAERESLKNAAEFEELKTRITQAKNAAALSDLDVSLKRRELLKPDAPKESSPNYSIGSGQISPSPRVYSSAPVVQAESDPVLTYMNDSFVVVRWKGQMVQLSKGQTLSGLTLTSFDTKSMSATVVNAKNKKFILGFNNVLQRQVPEYKSRSANVSAQAVGTSVDAGPAIPATDGIPVPDSTDLN